jgi:hypothetical protein
MNAIFQIDWSENNPDVRKGFKADDKQPDTITISHDGSYIRLSPTTIAKAFLTAAENGMQESVIDADAIKVIRKYLDD